MWHYGVLRGALLICFSFQSSGQWVIVSFFTLYLVFGGAQKHHYYSLWSSLLLGVHYWVVQYQGKTFILHNAVVCLHVKFNINDVREVIFFVAFIVDRMPTLSREIPASQIGLSEKLQVDVWLIMIMGI